MLSFGQRLKLIRKETRMTQAELAEKLMVSVQAVSKWECDNTMPDISQLVPLAVILGVTTDCLLGVGGDEKADREKLYKEIEAISPNNEYGVYAKSKDEHDGINQLYRRHIGRYPLDYDVKFRSANEICHYIYNAGHLNYSLSKEEESSLYTEAVNLLISVINYDRDTTRLLDAKQILIMLYLYRDDFSKAAAVAESLPQIGNVKAAMEIEIYSKKNDPEKCFEIAKKACADAANNYLWALGVRARKMLSLGDGKKHKAFLTWRDLIDGARFHYKVFKDIDINIKWLYSALNYLSNEYIKINEFDLAIETIEELAETLLANYNELKEVGDIERANELKSNMPEHLRRCYNWCFSSDDNIIAKDPRFKKCEDSLLALQ